MSYTPTTWVTLDVITATKANNWETQYAGVFDSSDKTATGAWEFSKSTSSAPTVYLSALGSYAQFGTRGVVQPLASSVGLAVTYNMVKRSANWKNIANAGISYMVLEDESIFWGTNPSPGSAETTFTPTDRMSLTSSTLALSVDFAINTNKFTVAQSSGNTVIAGTLNVSGTATHAALTATTGSFSSTLSATGDFAINTNKFTVAASSGNTLAAGTLDVTSDFKVNTNKFVVTASSGNTTVAGTLGVTGAGTFSSTLGVMGDFAVNTNKFTVAASSGNTVVAGTLGVTGAATMAAVSGTTGSFSSTLACTGNFAVNTNKFNVTASNGNTTVAGTFGVTGTSTFAAVNGTTGSFSSSLSCQSLLVNGVLSIDTGGNISTNGDLGISKTNPSITLYDTTGTGDLRKGFMIVTGQHTRLQCINDDLSARYEFFRGNHVDGKVEFPQGLSAFGSDVLNGGDAGSGGDITVDTDGGTNSVTLHFNGLGFFTGT